MNKKTLGELVSLDPVDIPTKRYLISASERLLKDFLILKEYKGKECEGFDKVADFLKFLSERIKD